jgi:hypothetical protein
MTDIIHRDFLGQELAVGDRVIIPDAHGYAGFNWGTIIKITPKMVRVAYKSESNYSDGEKVLDPRAVLKMGKEQEHYLIARILKS